MPKPRNAKLESATGRRKLAVRKKPYWTPISPGIHLGYRRNQTAGTWSVRVADGGAEWIKRIAVADDLEAASPPHVLSYWQAINKDAPREGGRPGEASKKAGRVTVAKAFPLKKGILAARGGSQYRAELARFHRPAVILDKPVALLGATELRKWR